MMILSCESYYPRSHQGEPYARSKWGYRFIVKNLLDKYQVEFGKRHAILTAADDFLTKHEEENRSRMDSRARRARDAPVWWDRRCRCFVPCHGIAFRGAGRFCNSRPRECMLYLDSGRRAGSPRADVLQVSQGEADDSLDPNLGSWSFDSWVGHDPFIQVREPFSTNLETCEQKDVKGNMSGPSPRRSVYRAC